MHWQWSLVHLPFIFTTLLISSGIIGCLAASRTTESIDSAPGDDHIAYHGPWTFKYQDDEPEIDPAYFGTLSYADIPGAICDITFEGTRITVYGAFYPPGEYDMQSSYTIDDGAATTFVPNPDVPQSQFRQIFYRSPVLSPGQHKLEIMNLARQFWFDFVQVENDPDGQGSPPPPATITSPSSSVAVTVTVTASPSSSPGSTGKSSIAKPASTPSLPSSISSSASAPNTSILSSSTHRSSITSPISSSPASSSASLSGNVDSRTALTSSNISPSTSNITPTVVGAASDHIVHDGLPIAGIVGIAIAGVLLLILLPFVVWWLHRKRRTKSRGFPFEQERFVASTAALRHDAQSTASSLSYHHSGEPRAHGTQNDVDSLRTPTSAAPLLTSAMLETRAYGAGMVAHSRTTESKHSGVTPVASSPVSPSDCDASPQMFVTPFYTGIGHIRPTATPFSGEIPRDGGVRLAGGPPGRMEPVEDASGIGASETVLPPPLYQYYP